MAMLDYWHPVLRGGELPRGRAVRVRLAGQPLALFREQKVREELTRERGQKNVATGL